MHPFKAAYGYEIKKFINESTHYMDELFELPSIVFVRICNIAEKMVRARFISDWRMIELSIVDETRTKIPKRQLLESFLHELTHAEQYHTSRLIDYGVGLCTFEGVVYPLHYIDDARFTEEEYVNAPWEVEARYKALTTLEIIEARAPPSLFYP